MALSFTPEEVAEKNWWFIRCLACGKTVLLGRSKQAAPLQRKDYFCFECEGSGRAYNVRESALFKELDAQPELWTQK
jgi:hypothetical protein